MMTESVNTPSTMNRAKAPAVGSHLALLNDRMAARIDSQTNASAMMNQTGVDTFAPWLKNTSTAEMQVIVSEPADHTRISDPVQEVVHRPGQVPEGQPGPVVGP